MSAEISNIKSDKLLSNMYFWGLVLMITSLPLSRFMMSVAQFTLSGILILQYINRENVKSFFSRNSLFINLLLIIPYTLAWILESLFRIFKEFFQKKNLPAIIFMSLYFLHVMGLIFTIDFDYALKDLRIKLPLFVLPLILTVSKPIDWKEFRNLMLFFVAAVLAGTFVSTYILVSQDVDNLRDISIFISHIRFSLLISIAIFTLAYFVTRKEEFSQSMRMAFIFLTLWLIFYLLLSASLTGLIVMLIAVSVMGIHYTLKKKNLYSRIATVVLILAPILLIVFLMGVVTDVYKIHRIDMNQLEQKTSLGNYYWHDTSNLQTENGYYVWLYVQMDELRDSWNDRSELDFDGKDHKGQNLKFTLIRYMTSKGLRKDAGGVNLLTDQDVALVESGEASAHYHERSVFYIRLYKIFWETQQYFRTGDPSGYSAMQRIEYWKTSFLIIRQHILIGVGTGDMNIAFERQYELMNSPLKPEFRWRSHNQFLSISVGFGLIGFIWFLVALIYPPLKLKRMNDYFFLFFFVIMIVSMISEDTIETQAGVTIFAFFTSLFLFGKKNKTLI